MTYINPHASLRFYAYFRKSSREDKSQVRSIEDQYNEGMRKAKQEGITIVKVFKESQSAKVPGRPDFNEMMRGIRNGEADGILGWHPDRLARNRTDGAMIIDMIDSGQLKALVFNTYWFESTPQGKRDLWVAFAESTYYSEKLSADVIRGYEGKIKAGLWPWRPPFVYVHEPSTKGIIPEPRSAKIWRKVYETFADADGAMTLSQLYEQAIKWGLRNRYGKVLSFGLFCRYLNDPVYYGMIRAYGKVHHGVHEPVVSKQLFEKVREIRKRRNGGRRRTKPHQKHPLRGLFRCGECGCAFTTETQKGHLYLRCTKKREPCSQRYVRAEDLACQIKALVKQVSINNDFADTIFAKLDTEQAHEHEVTQQKQRKLEDDLRLINRKIANLTNSHIAGAISLDEYLAIKTPLTTEKHEIECQIQEIQSNPDTRLELARTFIKCCIKARFLASSDDLAAQCQFLRRIGSNHIIRDKQATYSPRGHWKTVALYGPNRDAASWTDRVSGEIEDDFLKSAALGWLLEPVFEHTPLLSVGHLPLHTPVHPGGGAKAQSSTVLSPISLSA